MTLSQPNRTVSGWSLPGIPFIISGANDVFSWSLTPSPIDTEDVYIEHLRDDAVEGEGGHRRKWFLDTYFSPAPEGEAKLEDGRRSACPESVEDVRYEDVLWRGERRCVVWRAVEEREEEVMFNDTRSGSSTLARKEVMTVYRTSRGPIVSGLLSPEMAMSEAVLCRRAGAGGSMGAQYQCRLSLHSLALSVRGGGALGLDSDEGQGRAEGEKAQWAAGERGAFPFLKQLNMGATIEDIRRACVSLDTVAMNVMFAFNSGDIGYFVTGRFVLNIHV